MNGVEFVNVSKDYRLGQERVNLRQAVPGPWGAKVKAPLHHALSDLSFSIGPGEGLGIIGRNGAGKSTLLKLVAGVIAPTRGRVNVRGGVAALIELGAGFHPDMTGRENVDFMAAVLGMTRQGMARRLEQIIEFADIGPFLDTPIKRYSSGMLARLGFAVAAHLNADVLVLDEVLSVGDAAFQARCHDRIRELRSQGAVTLYVTHALWTLPILCNSAILLDSGEVVATGTPDEVLAAYRARSVSLGSIAAGGSVEVTQLVLDPPHPASGEAFVMRIGIDVGLSMPTGLLHISVVDESQQIIASAVVDELDALATVGPKYFVLNCAGLPLRPGNYQLFITVFVERDKPLVATSASVDMLVTGTRMGVELYGRFEIPLAVHTIGEMDTAS